MNITVEYTKKDDPGAMIHKAVFDNVEDAQLWWDSIVYLHTLYNVMNNRPR
jgi:hypothetical protein